LGRSGESLYSSEVRRFAGSSVYVTKVTDAPRPDRFVTAMARWTAETTITALPADVLMLLTEPDAISRWAPIPFDIVDWHGERLTAGEHVLVKGHLAGRTLEFEVDVTEADGNHLVLTATGPITIDVEYYAHALPGGSELRAAINVSGRGLLGRLLAQATDALLAAGALRTAVNRIAYECEPALAV
jgi:hypothetical protein